MKETLKRYRAVDPNNEGTGNDLSGICNAHLVTHPLDPVDHSLETTPFKNMSYMDMISGFR